MNFFRMVVNVIRDFIMIVGIFDDVHNECYIDIYNHDKHTFDSNSYIFTEKLPEKTS